MIIFTRKHHDGLESTVLGLPFDRIIMLNSKDENSYWLKYQEERDVKSCVVQESPKDVQNQLIELNSRITGL